MEDSLKQEIYKDIVRSLHEKYGSHFIRAADAGKEIGLSRKTIYNQVSEARFPIKTFKRGKLLLVSIYELARFILDYPDQGRLDAMREINARKRKQEQAATERKRGRPRKTAPPPPAAPERCDRTIDFVDAAGGESCAH